MDTSKLRRQEFWRSFAPGLRTDGSMLQKCPPLPLPPGAVPEFMRQLREDGYFQQSADWGVDLELMASTARALSQADLPPVFAFLYDQFWYPFVRLRSVYEGLLGGRYYVLPGCWVWNVDPKKGDSGWAPHRDAGRTALFEDGSPKSVTTWIPLSAATPLNGCMYIVPASQDPTYATADEVNWKGKFDYASIRALPANPGRLLDLESGGPALGRQVFAARGRIACEHVFRVPARRRTANPCAVDRTDARANLRHAAATRVQADPSIPSHVQA